MSQNKEILKAQKEHYLTKVRPFLKNGDILLCSGSGVFSRLIQIATETKWSHVGFIYRVPEVDRIIVFESVESIGVRAVPLSFYLENYNSGGKPYPGEVHIARHDDMSSTSSEMMKTLATDAIDWLGYPYDNDEIAKIAARIAASKIGIKKFKRLKKDKEFICSEYLARLFEHIDVQIKWNSKGFIAPSDVPEDPRVKILYQLV